MREVRQAPRDGVDGGGGGTGGEARPVRPSYGPGDPPDEDGGTRHGFDRWGGYVPPMGGERDPLINPVRMGYAADNMQPLALTSSSQGGVSIVSLSGTGGGGASVDGLMGATTREEHDGSNTDDTDRPIP